MNDPMGGRVPNPNEGTIAWAVMCVVGAAAAWPVDAAYGVIIRVDTTCEAMAPDACLGAYGFRIAETGAYVAGPSPDGRARNGQAAESQLFMLARRALADPAKSAAACPALGPIPGTRETVTVSLNEKTLVLKGDSGIIDKRCGETAGHLAELSARRPTRRCGVTILRRFNERRTPKEGGVADQTRTLDPNVGITTVESTRQFIGRILARLAICLSDNVRIKRSGPFIHLKTYAIDGELLRSGSAIFNASGGREQDNDLIVIRAQKPPGSRVLILRGERREKALPFKIRSAADGGNHAAWRSPDAAVQCGNTFTGQAILNSRDDDQSPCGHRLWSRSVVSCTF